MSSSNSILDLPVRPEFFIDFPVTSEYVIDFPVEKPVQNEKPVKNLVEDLGMGLLYTVMVAAGILIIGAGLVMIGSFIYLLGLLWLQHPVWTTIGIAGTLIVYTLSVRFARKERKT